MLSGRLERREPHRVATQHLDSTPAARPFAAIDAVPLLDWDTIDRVLRSERPLDVLTVAAGERVHVARPRSREDVARLMVAGVSVVVRAAEAHDPGLAALAQSFEQVLPGEVHVQLHITPAGTNSYGWSYGLEDVFVAQAVGVRDYHFRANTVATRLIAGDWLYLPARSWHLATCVENSLSISVSVMAPAALRDARHQLRPL